MPVFRDMFANLGGELPIPTQILVTLSSTALIWVPALIVIVGGASLWWRANKNKPGVRSRIDPIKLKLPVFGRLTTKIAIARFARNFAQMTAAGVPVLPVACRSSERPPATGSSRRRWVGSRTRFASAGTSRRPLMSEKAFPSMVVPDDRGRRELGHARAMLNKIADFYDEQVEVETKSLATAIEPIMTSLSALSSGSWSSRCTCRCST